PAGPPPRPPGRPGTSARPASAGRRRGPGRLPAARGSPPPPGGTGRTGGARGRFEGDPGACAGPGNMAPQKGLPATFRNYPAARATGKTAGPAGIVTCQILLAFSLTCG